MIKFINYPQTYPQELWKRNVGPKRQIGTLLKLRLNIENMDHIPTNLAKLI
jgi:hypothetical protein